MSDTRQMPLLPLLFQDPITGRWVSDTGLVGKEILLNPGTDFAIQDLGQDAYIFHGGGVGFEIGGNGFGYVVFTAPGTPTIPVSEILPVLGFATRWQTFPGWDLEIVGNTGNIYIQNVVAGGVNINGLSGSSFSDATGVYIDSGTAVYVRTGAPVGVDEYHGIDDGLLRTMYIYDDVITGSSTFQRTITDYGKVFINATGVNPLTVTHTDGNVNAQGSFEVARNQTTDLNNTVRGYFISVGWSTPNLGAARNLQGFFNNISFTGNLTGTNKMNIIGFVNNISISNASGRVGSGDSTGLYGAAFTFKTAYIPAPGNTGYNSGWIQIQNQYLHNGDSNGTTSSITGIDQNFTFGSGYKYTVISAYGILVSASIGAGAVGSSIVNLYGERISAPSIGAGVTVTNNYGLYIATVSGGVNNWSLYVLGGTSYFGGAVQENLTHDMTGGAGNWFRPTSMTTAQRNVMIAGWGVGDAGKMWFNTTTSQWEGWNGTAIAIIG